MQLQEAIRIILFTLFSFLVALALTPLVARMLDRFAIKKNIRSAEVAPVFNKFHEKKTGTPTMGGVIIWVTTLGIAFFFWAVHMIFDDAWSYFNIIDRAETYLPLATILIAGLFGLFDDMLGVLKIGPKGGGLSVLQKIFLYLVI